MAGINVTREDLQFLTGSSIPPEKFTTLSGMARRIIASAYRRDIDTATGRHGDVLNAVFTSIAVRLLTNPTGVSLLAAGAASVSFGGASTPLVLSATEVEMLRSLRPAAPSSLTFSGYDATVPVYVDDLVDIGDLPLGLTP